MRVVLVGAGSRSFGPATVRDVLLSDPLDNAGLDLVVVDLHPGRLGVILDYARQVATQLGRKCRVSGTTSLDEALAGADFVVTAIEVRREPCWMQDYHIPRKHGFKQIFGENGGPGSHFHALRTMKLIVGVAQAMERICPKAVLLNFTNPMHKVCEAVTRLTSIQTVGMCHGVMMGRGQVARFLGMEDEDVEVRACGINHFTFFQSLRDRRTGEDLYPRLREVEAQADPLYDWHEVGMSRILFRMYGQYPSPGANHYGEYIVWAEDFYAGQMHWYYDPREGHPWDTGRELEFVYTMGAMSTDRPVIKPDPEPWSPEHDELHFSGEPAAPLMEAVGCGVDHRFLAVNLPNRGYIPNLPDESCVETPGRVVEGKIVGERMDPIPEPLAALMRVQTSIQQLLVEAYAERSRHKLLQALLLEPTVTSYRNAVAMMDEMLGLQADLLPPLE